MRIVHLVALAIILLSCSDAVATTAKLEHAELSSNATPDSLSKESRARFLRAHDTADDDLMLLSTTDEERVKPSGLTKMAKQLKVKNTNLKKFAAAVEKAKANPSMLAVAAKKMKANSQKILARLTSMEKDNFTRLFKANFTPKRDMSTGRIKNREQLANYEEFYRLAMITGIK